MYHYVALLWNPCDLEAGGTAEALARSLEASAELQHTFTSTGMRVYSRASRTADLLQYCLPAGHGAILGRLFPSEGGAFSPEWKPDISDGEARRFAATAGGALIDRYWGGYIAFLTDPARAYSLVLRDPSGKVPCYRLQHAGVHVLFSDIADLVPMRDLRLTLDFDFLSAFIYHTWLQIRRTAFREIAELLAGECLELRGSSVQQRILWNPCTIAAEQRPATYEEAVEQLRYVTQSCIDAWASVHPRVLHRLSGGLDSSIVLGCLSVARTPPTVVCVNEYVEDAEGDERAYARMCANRAKVRLVEAHWDAEDFAFDARLLSLPPTARPSFSQCVRFVQLDAQNQVAERYGADAYWTGQGGDHLFLKDSATHSAADFVAEQGLRPGLIGAVRDDARASRRPYALVLRTALGRGRAVPDGISGRSAKRGYFVRPEALPDDIERFIAHPWTLESDRLPPGKRRHIELIGEVVNRHRPIPGREYAFQHHPLLSQPILEQCLRTPTYLLLRGGRHRALARDAFADVVPAPILQRESKGEATASMVDRLRESAPFLCDLLLDGLLARERIIDRAALESIIREGRALVPDQLPPLLGCIAAEVWMRSWSALATARAAVASPATGRTVPPFPVLDPPHPSARTGTSR